jgi:acyl-CoA dehydrogenase
MLDTSYRTAFTGEQDMFRNTVRQVFDRELIPKLEMHERNGVVDRDFWLACGEAGLLCPTVKEEFGGLGLDFGFNAVVAEELAYAGSSASLPLQSDIIVEYIATYGSEEQKRNYLPKMVSGECLGAIAMTEPGAGSDLQGIKTTAQKDGNHYVINGSKTYITNGVAADLILVVAKTDPTLGAKGISIILVDADAAGFKRGRNLDKIGQHCAATSELFFEDVRVPITNCLGEEGLGFAYMMSQLPQERLSIAVSAQASAQRAFDEALSFTKDRKAFGQQVFQFQNTKFSLADMKSQLQVGWAHLDWALKRHVPGGAGHMNEYLIARLWRDARVTRIYGGTNEIMKEVVSRSL